MELVHKFSVKEQIKYKNRVKGVSFVPIEFPCVKNISEVLLKENSSIERNPRTPNSNKKFLQQYFKNISDMTPRSNRQPKSLTPQNPFPTLPESSITSIIHDNSSMECIYSPRHNKKFLLWKDKLSQLQLKKVANITPRSNVSVSPSLLKKTQNSLDDNTILQSLKPKSPSKMPKSQYFRKRLPARYMPKISIKKFTQVTKNGKVAKIIFPISKTPTKHQASCIQKLSSIQEKLYLYNSSISNNSFSID
ncbi:hypothetical protein SteCoe_25177 [Stentor coeruleus]|uniref:Uncharacterized protein n=1 Tax=Stentor coeruleus TaxID=5963 RepID=A0A1R2BFX7_9CILI|nr:hypothetical protein SteCoe_25177 [Stentor coeruleus]